MAMAGDTRPRDAVILAAGLGSRFGDDDDVKPLARLGVLGLVERNVRIMSAQGLERVVIVVGHRGPQVESALREVLRDCAVELVFAHNPDFAKKNGLSASRGARCTRGPYLLLMADHIFAPSILAHALRERPPERGGVLYVDRKVGEVFDLDDATKVATDGHGRLVAIGKQLVDFDAVDTGLFVMTGELAERIDEIVQRTGDCSLSEGVQALAAEGVMGTRDIGASRWQDVDTLQALEHAHGLFGDDLSWP
jgi:1L-myo-inositol 1-phosphate cytidylyltransferase